MATATNGAKRLFELTTKGRQLPGRYIIYGPEKIGKTSLAAQFPGAVFIQAQGETGLETLIDSGQLPPVPHIPGEVEDWPTLLAAVEWIRTSEHDHRTLVIDGIDSIQKLCFEHVRDTAFGGDEGKFMAYHKGFDQSPNTWKELLVSLDGLRHAKKMAVVLIAHARVSKKKNPGGEDWSAYTPNLHEKIWEPTAAWADAIFFIDFETIVGDDGKGKGGKVRVIYTEHDASYDAGNRLGLRGDIECGESPQEAFKNLSAAIKAARSGKESK